MNRWGDYFWFRFLWGMFLLPFVGLYLTWREGDIAEELTVPILLFFVVWEVIVVALMRWRGLWPFKSD